MMVNDSPSPGPASMVNSYVVFPMDPRVPKSVVARVNRTIRCVSVLPTSNAVMSHGVGGLRSVIRAQFS